MKTFSDLISVACIAVVVLGVASIEGAPLPVVVSFFVLESLVLLMGIAYVLADLWRKALEWWHNPKRKMR